VVAASPPPESFVDVTYQGLELGRRVKLTEVAPDAGYLEVAAPMPVGTTLALAIEGGLAITAVVRVVHEQVGGSDRAPGMQIKPVLEGEAATRWWAERVTRPAAPPAPAVRRTKEMTAAEADVAKAISERVRADSGAPPFADDRKKTRVMPEGEVKAALAAAQEVDARLARGKLMTPTDGVPAQVVDEDGLIDDGRKTEVMSAVDPELLARLTGSGDLPVMDDGKRTTIMDVPPVMDDDSDGNGGGDDGDDGGDDAGASGAEEPSPSASGKLPPARGKGKRRRNSKVRNR
jgi:hypothetical protein